MLKETSCRSKISRTNQSMRIHIRHQLLSSVNMELGDTVEIKALGNKLIISKVKTNDIVRDTVEFKTVEELLNDQDRSVTVIS